MTAPRTEGSLRIATTTETSICIVADLPLSTDSERRELFQIRMDTTRHEHDTAAAGDLGLWARASERASERASFFPPVRDFSGHKWLI